MIRTYFTVSKISKDGWSLGAQWSGPTFQYLRSAKTEVIGYKWLYSQKPGPMGFRKKTSPKGSLAKLGKNKKSVTKSISDIWSDYTLFVTSDLYKNRGAWAVHRVLIRRYNCTPLTPSRQRSSQGGTIVPFWLLVCKEASAVQLPNHL